MKLLSILLVLISIMWNSSPITKAQEPHTIRGPISAIRVDGQRLLLGQGSTLIEAQFVDQQVKVIRAIDLHHHDIRAITVAQGITFALSEDGLTTLDRNSAVLDYVRGGGQRIAVSGGRIYVAALQAGVRLLTVDAVGKLSALGNLVTAGPARDIAPESNGLVWVAEVDQGIRLYDAQNIATARAITWVKALAPATALRVTGTHLIVGHGSTLTIVDTLDQNAPRLIGHVALDKGEVNDLVIAGTRVFAGMKAPDGPDLIVLDIADLKAPRLAATFGSAGAGEWLAFVAKSNDMFVGSGRQGLRQLNVAGQPLVVQSWDTMGTATTCALTAPTQPQPASGEEISGSMIMLQWSSTCAVSYEVQVNGQVIGTTKESSYSVTLTGPRTTWQVTAIDSSGNRAEGPTWTLDQAAGGWLSTPAPLPNTKLLYTPPLTLVDLRSPQQVLILTCAALLIGFIVVIGTAWYLGMRAEQRRLSKL